MKVFRNLLLVFVVLTCCSACSDADDDISINDVNNVIEDEFSGYRELIGIWEGGWYDLGMKLSADKKCRMYRGEPFWSGEGTWEYNADSKILTTTCGYTLTIERLNSGELWCRDQYGELYMLRRRSSILNPDELPSWWDFDINRRVIVGTWKNGTKAVTLKFYKDGQFLLSNGFASYVGNFFFGDEITGDGSIYLSSDSFEFGDGTMRVFISGFSGMYLGLGVGTSSSNINETMVINMITGYYTYVKN